MKSAGFPLSHEATFSFVPTQLVPDGFSPELKDKREQLFCVKIFSSKNGEELKKSGLKKDGHFYQSLFIFKLSNMYVCFYT